MCVVLRLVWRYCCSCRPREGGRVQCERGSRGCREGGKVAWLVLNNDDQLRNKKNVECERNELCFFLFIVCLQEWGLRVSGVVKGKDTRRVRGRGMYEKGTEKKGGRRTQKIQKRDQREGKKGTTTVCMLAESPDIFLSNGRGKRKRKNDRVNKVATKSTFVALRRTLQ